MWIKKFGIAHRIGFACEVAFLTQYQMLTKVYEKMETIVATTTQNS